MAEFVLSYDDVPPSLNAGGAGSRRHWGAAHREKRRWEGIFTMLLMARRAPRGMSRCSVDVVIEFNDRRRRDAENYRPGVSKPLADALVKGQWLADDTDEFFQLREFELRSGVDFDDGTLKRPPRRRTVVTITAEYPVPA